MIAKINFFDLQPEQKLNRWLADKEGGKTHTLYHENFRVFGFVITNATLSLSSWTMKYFFYFRSIMCRLS